MRHPEADTPSKADAIWINHKPLGIYLAMECHQTTFEKNEERLVVESRKYRPAFPYQSDRPYAQVASFALRNWLGQSKYTDAHEKSWRDAKQNSVCAAMAAISASAGNGAVARGCRRMLF